MRAVHTAATLHDDPTPLARMVDRGARMTVKPLLRLAPVHERTFRRLQRFSAAVNRGGSPDITAEVGPIGGVPGEVLTPGDGPTTGLHLLYLHGGGFFTGSIHSYRSMLEEIVRVTGGTIYAIDYRQLPDHPVADSVQDAISAYEDVVRRAGNPEKVVVAGDSAGGYLTMKVAELARRRGLPAPAALMAFSPLLSLEPDRQDKNVLRVDKVREAILPIARVAALRRLWLQDDAIIEGFADPLHATAYITSPTHRVAVEDEFLRPEVEAFALLLDDKDVEVDVHLWRGQLHAFPIMAGYLPDADLAIELAAEFALTHIGEPPAVEIDDTGARSEQLEGELAAEPTPERQRFFQRR
ncbi:alpha/beta hydrolase fold domain-containing protein [Aeromicrobium senzhongii]|uniref:Alpha/beta hydrolase fold domain-containing protein n=1 Tax=Aeromicrobium senzhongii TaxID=2663859 RepID=A0ABX6ST98_9ACTN|nr:alpha/beta hydrolase fold domain-containing protein [Aeromicrobium senzhongii]MTB89618.1 alpha/beta hydrolase fold domain-containing protein [Aeromicrobium senzhongii]QNL94256.1 alpha/beta hydrolase fold domain-containing protein [Aeromicrobium senzhongii]